VHKVLLALQEPKVSLVVKVQQVLKEPKVHKVQTQEPKVIQDFKAHKGHRVLQDQLEDKAHKELKVIKEPMVLLERQDSQDLQGLQDL
jgi:phage terminase small subunit